MFPNQNAILERLELTKKLGLVSDYLLSWTGQSGHLTPKVTVWGSQEKSDDTVRFCTALLLRGLVNSQRINVAID